MPPLPDEVEVAYLALRHTLLGGYVLRSRDRAGAGQEVWALLTVYQALRMAMTAATGSVPGTDPDRASFTAALEAAREQVITARGIEDPGSPGGTGRIGRAVLAGLLPARRARYSARKVKCSTSRYHVRGQDRPGLPTRIIRVQVTIIAPPPDRPAAQPRSRKNQPPGPRPPQPDTRRDKVTAIMASQPGSDWAGRDLAAMLGIKPRNMLTQLAEWTRLGFLAKTGPGRYALPGLPGQAAASAAPAAGQQDPAPADIIATTGGTAGARAPSLTPPAPFPAPAHTPRHRRQVGRARKSAHGPGTQAARQQAVPARRNGCSEQETRTVTNRDCAPVSSRAAHEELSRLPQAP